VFIVQGKPREPGNSTADQVLDATRTAIWQMHECETAALSQGDASEVQHRSRRSRAIRRLLRIHLRRLKRQHLIRMIRWTWLNEVAARARAVCRLLSAAIGRSIDRRQLPDPRSSKGGRRAVSASAACAIPTGPIGP
jgi:hypothetical protein